MEIKPLKEITLMIKDSVLTLWMDFLQLSEYYGYIALLISGCFFWMIFRVQNLKLKALFAFLYMICGLILWISFEYLSHKRIVILEYSFDFKDFMLTSFILSLLISFFLLRWIEKLLDRVRWRLGASSSRARQSKTDIRTVHKLLPKAKKQYIPTKYFNFKKGYFFGLDERNKPVYLDKKFMMSTHSVCFGPTGFGKGAACQVRLAQHIEEGDTVICFDPKFDEYMPHVLYSVAKKFDRKFIFLDLLGTEAQLSLTISGTIEQKFELFCGGFGLSNRGEASDYYQKISRNVLRKFIEYCEGKEQEFRQLVSGFLADYGVVDKDEKNCIESLKELSSISVIQAKQGIDLDDAIGGGAVVYVRGSLRNDSIMDLQRMLLIKILQICETNKHDSSLKRNTAIMLDEAKHLLSKPVLQILGTARDAGISAILCMQSKQDMLDCRSDINPEAVQGIVTENALVRINYRVLDPDSREFISRLYSSIEVDDETRSFSTTALLSEFGTGERTLKRVDRPLIDENMLAALPARCAVLGCDKLAQFIFTSPVPVNKDPAALIATQVENSESVHISKSSSIGEELINVD